MKSNLLTGQIILFGPTAQGVIILHYRHESPNKPIVVILRSNAHPGTDSGSGGTMNTSAGSNDLQIFEHRYNALSFKINPGAKDTKTNSDLSTSDSLSQIYKTLFGTKDLDHVERSNTSNENAIKTDKNKAKEYSNRLKSLGFRLPKFKNGYGKNKNRPAWLNPNWKPFDYIMKDGIPHNKKGKLNPKSVESDAAYSSITPDNDSASDSIDSVHYPSELKKKDGTTTNNDSNNSDSSNSGQSQNDSKINGGDVIDPSSLWNDLQQAWNDILQRKHTILSNNALEIFQTKATIHNMNDQSSVGNKKHFREVN